MREFLKAMEEKGLVEEIPGPVSAEYEAAKIAAEDDRILRFRDLDGGEAVMNLTANRRTLAHALGMPEEEIVPRLADTCYEGGVKIGGKIRMEEPDLSSLPVMKFYPGDAGRYITAGIVFARLDGVENASIHRMLVLDEKRVAARLVEGRHTHSMLMTALDRGERLPVAVAIGVHPAVTFASTTRVPPGMELSFAAELLGGGIRVARCGNGVLVPDAEIVLEGFIGAERAREGPFVDITGTYDEVRQEPVIEFTGMRVKEGAIYASILPGGDEHKILMGVPYEPIIYRAVSKVTGVRNVHLTRGGCGYLHAVIQVKKATQGDGKSAILAAFAAHTSLKHVVIVDEDIDPFDIHDVEFAVATRVRGDRDILVVTGTRGSSLDPCQAEDGTNVKVGIDATMPMGEEERFRRAGWD
ncbi:MAG TPA: UbiD family decarboxylase [Methanomicrobiales archaeon]|jgi:UbiD family decarboxylase|nr:UbiD family decarboxylase [Methanomicrobiales archaeon]